MVTFIAEQAETGIVYVHCKIGYSRSAAAVIAWLAASDAVSSVNEGVELLRRVRPSIVVRPEIHVALADFDARR